MLHPGLVSVTFRDLEPDEIVQLASKAGLEAIEWGGDVHVFPGNIATAKEVRAMTEDAGLVCSSYGSYYRLACAGTESTAFAPVLDSAIALGVPTIRVWAGNRGSAEADEEWWSAVIDDALITTNVAAEHGITIALEFHSHTLTDTAESALRLLKAVDHAHFRTYWQPPTGATVGDCLDGLRQVKPWLTNLHVHYLEGTKNVGLDEGTDAWKAFLNEADDEEHERYALLEFVPDNSPESFLHEAEVLKRLLPGQA